MNNQNLTIGTLNTRSLQDNIGYINIAALKTSILFLSETKSTKQLNTDEIIYLNNKKIFSKNATRKKKTGNSSGGLAFIVDSNLKCKVKFISNRIGHLLLNKLCLIGVYMTCNDSDINSLIDFEAELELIFQTIKNKQKEGYECLILGDFNVDMNKHGIRSNLLQNYLNTFRYELKDQQHKMSVDYTYEMIRKNKKTKKIEVIHSFVDHVAGPICNTNITYIDVVEELGNNSDHNMILFNYILQRQTRKWTTYLQNQKKKKHISTGQIKTFLLIIEIDSQIN
jgi:exonuclease III